jgi:hypothetical protein
MSLRVLSRLRHIDCSLVRMTDTDFVPVAEKDGPMKVNEIMTKDPVTCTSDMKTICGHHHRVGHVVAA